MMFDREEIKKNLIEYIKDNPISITRLAAKMDLTFETLNEIIKGSDNLPRKPQTWLKIAKFLKDNKN